MTARRRPRPDGYEQVYVAMPPGLHQQLREYAARQVPRLSVSDIIVLACVQLTGYDPQRDEPPPAGSPPDP